MKPCYAWPLLVIFALQGCAATNLRSQSPEGLADVLESRTKLVGDVARPFGHEPTKVESLALITGLDNTGEDPAPSPQRAALLHELQTIGVQNPNQLLASPSTALVLVRGFLPPGVQKGDKFDLEVQVPPHSETTSLRGGWLMETRMAQMAMLGGAVREGHTLAHGEGKPILIQGESGTGKELVARALHEASPLAEKPLVVINCAALPETLLESELFGYEKGAFTGAVGMKPGLFEVADGGTLFIDEIGELALSLQAKLLRVLEDGTLRRVGSVKERRVRVRLLAATNRDLLEEVRDKRFREDLFYRINVLTIHLPPLRERAGDLAILVEHFAGREWRLDPDVVPTLERYSWPGNVRQLLNALDRAKILSDDDIIRVENLPPEIVSSVKHRPHQASNDVDLDTITREHVLETYRRHSNNKARTARALGIGRRTLYRLFEKYQIAENGPEKAAAETDI